MRTTKAWRRTVCAGLLAAACVLRAEEVPAPPAVGTPVQPTPEQVAELHRIASSLWDQFVPAAVKEEYELIPRDEFIALLTRVEAAGREEDLAAYAAYAAETRAAIAALWALPDFADYADWLREQLEDMEFAGEAVRAAPVVPPPVPAPKDAPVVRAAVPLYELWRERMATRAAPARAVEFLPVVRAAFAAEGVPEALVWLAETESSFNPRARCPAGARGLFQIMPETAKSLGLSLFPFDQRTNPERSARAAAVYLKSLYARFGDWPLALAAYNAGQGRVARTLAARGATDFAGIAEHLPAETRLYVPKVLATVNARTGVAPDELAAPTVSRSP
jgi:membrane-bound lytic murein transglycosylase D